MLSIGLLLNAREASGEPPKMAGKVLRDGPRKVLASGPMTPSTCFYRELQDLRNAHHCEGSTKRS